MLFEPQQRSTTRRRRIDHWLLLLLRMAVLLLIAAAFAEPYVRGHLPGAAPERLLVLALDDSFSMHAGTRMEEARRAALAVVAAKPRDTRAQVVALGSRADVLTEQLQDTGALAAAIRRIGPTDARGSLVLLAGLARTLAAGTHMPIELHLFSDMQATQLPPDFSELRLPRGRVSGAAQGRRGSHSELDGGVGGGPGSGVGSGQDADHCHRCGLRHRRGEPYRDAAHQWAPVRPAAPSRCPVIRARLGGLRRSRYPLRSGARHGVQIDSADALNADDRYDFVIQRSERVHGLFVHQGSDRATGLYFRSALESAADAAVVLDEVTTKSSCRTRDLVGLRLCGSVRPCEPWRLPWRRA